MKLRSLLAVGVAAGLSVTAAHAQPGGPDGPPGQEPPRGFRPPGPLMRALDTNTNGIIDADEIANASAALLKLDANGDGKLTADELRPPRPPQGTNQFRFRPPPRHGPGVPPLMAALDTNHDGVLSADEIANASAALLKLDANGDGRLTPDELRPKRPRDAGDPSGPPRHGDSEGQPQIDGPPGPGAPDDMAPPEDAPPGPPPAAPEEE